MDVNQLISSSSMRRPKSDGQNSVNSSSGKSTWFIPMRVLSCSREPKADAERPINSFIFPLLALSTLVFRKTRMHYWHIMLKFMPQDGTDLCFTAQSSSLKFVAGQTTMYHRLSKYRQQSMMLTKEQNYGAEYPLCTSIPEYSVF